jgi:hypothetical protein
VCSILILVDLRLEIDPDNQRTFGPCECCGQLTTRVWGYIYQSNEARAAYFVEWTPGYEPAQANFDLIVGEWGEGTTAAQRQAVSLEYRVLDSGPAFMVVDAGAREVKSSPLIKRALNRTDVIGTPLAAEIFALCDAIYLDDPRIAPLKA